MDTELHSRWLPDGRFELTLGKCVPVIVRSATFFAKTQSELYCLVGLLTLIVGYLNKEQGCNLPEKTSLKKTSLCVVDQTGTTVWQGK